jgi:hypothetical protein
MASKVRSISISWLRRNLRVQPAAHDRSRYEGTNLLRLLLALGIPSLILFFSLTFGFAASESRVTHSQYDRLLLASRITSAIFFVVELFCARYVQGLLRIQVSKLRSALQYAGVLLFCIFISIVAAIACQSFGYRFYLAAHRR